VVEVAGMAALVGLVSQKGGVGKSTLARLVAREYAAAGWQVKIADLDISQGTSTDWKQRRERSGVKPDIAVEPFGTVTQALKVTQLYDLVVFDGPPHSMAGTLEIANVCDAIVLPTGLSLDDLKPSVLLAHELIQSRIPADRIVFALCRVGDRENEIAEARGYIRRAAIRFSKASCLRERDIGERAIRVGQLRKPLIRARGSARNDSRKVSSTL